MEQELPVNSARAERSIITRANKARESQEKQKAAAGQAATDPAKAPDHRPHYGEHGGGERRGQGDGGQAQYGDSSYETPVCDSPTCSGKHKERDAAGATDHHNDPLPETKADPKK
jgi:hypothetical protein